MSGTVTVNLSAAEILLGRLKDERHRAGEPVAQPGQDLRDTHADRGVHVVATEVGRLRSATDLLGRGTASISAR